MPARKLWQKILEMRLQTGEPYMIFSDTVNEALAKHQSDQGLRVQQSNLCAEIMLPTGLDKYGKQRTAVCCLSSINAEKYDEWKDKDCLLYTSPSPRDATLSRMPSSA